MRFWISLLLLVGLLLPINLVAIANQLSYGQQFINRGLNSEDFARCENIVRKAFQLVPKRHTDAAERIHLHNDLTLPRGLAGKDVIYLRCGLAEKEIISVFIHELGHVVDLGVITSPYNLERSRFINGTDHQYHGDDSIAFYEISWEDQATLKEKGLARFVSGYASSNAFEDFAESYLFYVLHGEKFRLIAETNTDLNRKYNFFRYIVFGGHEFNLQNNNLYLTRGKVSANMSSRFDATKLTYELYL